ncbi:uncharacterized protein LOC107036707 isoform X2 [Diachasma alloeum]|uniref:uncharacterized protein LOC107036707 isoform X2 n=1 Tax=Diachasma alloeum TaxID=454923 RepID=UPI0007382939|nr:uncharacterized protein LOC107036707 isoform X2 [Diachasma alloeum]
MLDNWRSWFRGTTSHGIICIYMLLVCRVQESSQEIVIQELKVPRVVEAGDNTSVILDCVYDLQNTSTNGLVVKWFVNDTTLLYQWIYGIPPVVDEQDNHIEVGYKATDDPTTMYRAMKINNLNINHTGDYKCNVFTYFDDASRETPMIVYSAEETFDLKYEKNEGESGEGVEVTCSAEGLYPEPTLEISVNDVVVNRTEELDAVHRDDGKYNITAILIAEDEDLPSQTVVKCTLSIPKANYTNWRFITFSSDGTTPTLSTSLIMAVILLLSADMVH